MRMLAPSLVALGVVIAAGVRLPAQSVPTSAASSEREVVGGQALSAGEDGRVDKLPASFLGTVDPIAHLAYLKASNTDAGDEYGTAIALSGNTLVVGAYLEDSGATGIDGNQADESALLAGAAYVYVRDGTDWAQQAYVKASNTAVQNWFGYSVAISGDTLVVGAPLEYSLSSGVNGDQTQVFGTLPTGAVYVFVRDGQTWTQEAYLKASNPQIDLFGGAVAVSGDTIVVGASLDSTQENSSGAAYVFVRNGTTWSQEAYLKAPIPQASANFGESVAIDGETLVVGIPGEITLPMTRTGAASVFTRSGTTWSEQAHLTASNLGIGDHFGAAVAISGETLVVGAPDEDSAASGVDGDQNDNSASGSGAAYVFVRAGVSWSQEAYLKAIRPATVGDNFGTSVAVDGDVLIAGAPWEVGLATGANGDPYDLDASRHGAAYLFTRSGTAWSHGAYIKASNTPAKFANDSQDAFGHAVALSGNTVAVSAPFEKCSATGVNGLNDELAPSAGAAYTYALDGAWGDLANTLDDGFRGDPRLLGGGELADGELSRIDLSNAAPSAAAGLFIGFDPNTPVPFKQGTLVPVPFFKLLFANTSPSGTIPLPFVMPLGVPGGFHLYVQWAITDAGAPAGVALSNALVGVTP